MESTGESEPCTQMRFQEDIVSPTLQEKQHTSIALCFSRDIWITILSIADVDRKTQLYKQKQTLSFEKQSVLLSDNNIVIYHIIYKIQAP